MAGHKIRGEGQKTRSEGPKLRGEGPKLRGLVSIQTINGKKMHGSKSATDVEKDPRDANRRNFVKSVRDGYEEVVNAFIRPSRARYEPNELGPQSFTFCGRRFSRVDAALRNPRGLSLQCSHWKPQGRERLPCVVYLHGNSSCRLEVLPHLSYLLSLDVSVFSFDFSGCGRSQGEFVSLGYHEREDLASVLEHLKPRVGKIALWGRSMGAATALMLSDPTVACMVLDSSFSDLTRLAGEIVEREGGALVPGFVVSMAMNAIGASVKARAGFEIRKTSPIAKAGECEMPALFLAGRRDAFIDRKHSEALHERYAGEKRLVIVDGDHNSPREKNVMDEVSKFLEKRLNTKLWAEGINSKMKHMCTPWVLPGAVCKNPRMKHHIKSQDSRTMPECDGDSTSGFTTLTSEMTCRSDVTMSKEAFFRCQKLSIRMGITARQTRRLANVFQSEDGSYPTAPRIDEESKLDPPPSPRYVRENHRPPAPSHPVKPPEKPQPHDSPVTSRSSPDHRRRKLACRKHQSAANGVRTRAFGFWLAVSFSLFLLARLFGLRFGNYGLVFVSCCLGLACLQRVTVN